MSISTFIYSIKEGIKNIRRNRMFSLASIGTIMACLFLFGIFYFMLTNFQYMIKNAESGVAITVFFEDDATEEMIKEIGDDIKARPEVKEVTYLTAKEAWESFKVEYFKDHPELAETFGTDNPLEKSSSYSVFLKNIDDQKSLVQYIETLQGVRQVNNSEATANGIKSFNTLIGYISAAIIIILISVAVFLINTTVTMGISVRKGEISIMKLIGATDYFIRAPFIVEGLIIGIVGAIIPLFGLRFLYSKVVEYISVKFSALNSILVFLDVETVFASLIPISLAIGVGIGFFGSFLTVRRHLRV